MVNIQSKNQARKLVREAQAKAHEERAQREQDNVEDCFTDGVDKTGCGWPNSSTALC